MMNTGHRVTMIMSEGIVVDSVRRGRCLPLADVRSVGEPIPLPDGLEEGKKNFATMGEGRKWQPCDILRVVQNPMGYFIFLATTFEKNLAAVYSRSRTLVIISPSSARVEEDPILASEGCPTRESGKERPGSTILWP